MGQRQGSILHIDGSVHPINMNYEDLEGANLTHADLEGANLRGADLTNAALEDANLTGVVVDERTILPDRQRRLILNANPDLNLYFFPQQPFIRTSDEQRQMTEAARTAERVGRYNFTRSYTT